jgi:hypothetical protein
MAANNEPRGSDDESLQDQTAAELDADNEQISLEDANKVSGGGGRYGSSGGSGA